MGNYYLVSAKGELIVSAYVYSESRDDAIDYFIKKIQGIDKIDMDEKVERFSYGECEFSILLDESTIVGELECEDIDDDLDEGLEKDDRHEAN